MPFQSPGPLTLPKATDERPKTVSYETAIAQMYALGHELATTPSHKFDLAHMRVLLGALGHPEKKLTPRRGDRGEERGREEIWTRTN